MITVLSPHTDDAAWSVGEHILDSTDTITVATPFAGIPSDPSGYKKHHRLAKEHTSACKLLKVQQDDGSFLDDVYPRPDYKDFEEWIATHLHTDEVWIPLGIHHPDHVMVHHTAVHVWKWMSPRPTLVIYEELPYRTRYQELASNLYLELYKRFSYVEPVPRPSDGRVMKRVAVLTYESQVDDGVLADVMVPEQMWRVA